ncbi:MAG: rod shape-determining protein RodA [Chloroflexi bacterium]|nr:rod shape-determining protein RodA [Chloroflexota bacterium]MCL5025503.1 rod shape-determining protein RodA [Chloroflexota bacterium]
MERDQWKQFDFLLMAVVLVLVGWGLAMIYSATYRLSGTPAVDPRVYQQAVFLAVGLLAAAVVLFIDYNLFRDFAMPIYIVGVLSLAGVLVIGQITHGSQRWVDLGFFSIQPSEPAKLTVIIGLSRYLADHEDQIHEFKHILVTLLMAAIPAGLTLAQPDMTTAAVYIAIWLGMAVMAGMRFWHTMALTCFGIATGPLAWMFMHDYQRDRVRVFLGLEDDPTGKGYNAIQAVIGVGAGGWFGRGFTSGTQSQLHFLRVQYADYIFSVLAEELGFIGALALFFIFLFLCWRCLGVAGRCPQTFPRLVVTGVVVMFAFQVFVNIGMNIGLLPPAGVTLPFISYGGSSLITALAAVGLVQNVALRRREERR